MMTRLADIVGPTLARAGLDPKDERWRIGDIWEQAVGRAVAAHASPVELRKGELTIAVADATWRQELALLVVDLKDRINAALGEEAVARVRVIGGPVVVTSPPEVPRRRGGASAAAVRQTGARSKEGRAKGAPSGPDGPPTVTLVDAFAALRAAQPEDPSRRPSRQRRYRP